MSLPIPLHARQGDGQPSPDPPEPIPLPGDLRVAQLGGPGIDPHLVGRWQIQVYDDAAGGWRPVLNRDLSGRMRYWQTEPTFATEAEALEYLFARVRRGRAIAKATTADEAQRAPRKRGTRP